jgi:phosphoribosylformimino-5-aminoimidazole carboxamide ribonucleotide (ProFAR) isomerase
VRPSGVAYLPFAGRPAGHPTRLGGSPDDVAADCRRFVDKGCAGVDLLAYRATEAEPTALIRAARGALGDRQLVVAGSIDSRERIAAVAAAGADAFTIGSAVFDGSYAKRVGGTRAQLRAVLGDLAAVAA